MDSFLLLPSCGCCVSHFHFDTFLIFFVLFSLFSILKLFNFLSAASFWISVMCPLVTSSLSIIGYTLGDPNVWRAYRLSCRQIRSN